MSLDKPLEEMPLNFVFLEPVDDAQPDQAVEAYFDALASGEADPRELVALEEAMHESLGREMSPEGAAWGQQFVLEAFEGVGIGMPK